MKGVRLVKGRLVCLTAWDAWGRAHVRHPWPGAEDWTLCGRKLGLAAVAAPNGKSCAACSALAPEANKMLRGERDNRCTIPFG